MKNLFFLFAGLFAMLSLSALGQNSILKDLKPKKWEEIKNPIQKSFIQDEKIGQCFTVDPVAIQNWYEQEPDLIRINIAGRSELIQKQEIFASDFHIVTSEGQRLDSKEARGVHYAAMSGVFAVSIFKDHISAVFSDENTNWNFGPHERDKNKYILVSDKELPPMPFECHTVKDLNTKTEGAEKSAISNSSCKVVRIGLEADHSFANIWTPVQTANYLSGLFNVAKTIYRNDKIAITFGSLFIWTTPDPYATNFNIQQTLYNFATNRPVAQMTDNLLHLVSLRFNRGGVAYTDILCNSFARHGVNYIFSSYNSLPVYSWSTYVLSHEIGHNFGSKHAFWNGWKWEPGAFFCPNATTNSIGQLDSTWTGEAVTGSCNFSSSTKSVAGGSTIMGYGHQTSAGVNFSKGFGKLPGNLMRSRLANATCIPVISSPICDSLPGNEPPPPPPPAQCVEGLIHFTNASGQSCFRFNIRPGCRYTVNYCRYDGFAQSNQPQPGQQPSACGIRNGLNNYLPTPNELAAGFVERVANSQPWERNRWYAVRVSSTDGPTQLNFFWWP